MKKIISIAVLGAVLACAAPQAYAATTTSTPAIGTSASVASALTLNVVMKKNDFSGATISSMNFGELRDIGTGTLRSSPTSTTGTGAVATFITANSQGLPYTITQTGTPMQTSGGTPLPAGALVVKAIYNAADNAGAGQPSGSSLPTSGGASWVGTRTLYTSGSTDPSIRTITAFYSVTDAVADGSTAAVPLSQPAGNYTGTVTISVTA